ncbi:MAG TPA: 5-(carboxyamino)imidazole ribonucleotide synthase [Rhodospirillaceae bacterium]|nr:5-(carboxyamino)imidazole ribonucleotide synthase [Rhodospirillaceae bacterium]
MSADPGVIAPGSTIGIIGGGQLGRMTALAAARLGYRCHIFCPDEDAPAVQVAQATIAAFDDARALVEFAAAVDVVTFEFENIPAASLRILADHVAVRPDWPILETAQDRRAEKTFFQSIGSAVADWQPVDDADGLAHAVDRLGRPSVLKTARLGYDGKGQVKIAPGIDLAEAWAEIQGQECILESFIDFEREISVIVARGTDGATACFDVVENRHRNHILDVTMAPAQIDPRLAGQAAAIATRAAVALNLIGLLAVEMFVTADGRLLVNEMAPRPHNSGHWTMDACLTDQFEQLVRAICGLPLGSPERHSDAVMTNLIGPDVDLWLPILKEPESHLHLYGKSVARPGRKMGHVTRLTPRPRI